METKLFETVMLLCFGAAWPLSIYRLYVTKNSYGKSIPFLIVVFIGYLSGICHKVFVNFDNVIGLYVLNAIMVGIDLILTVRFRRKG